jgi:Zn-dependent protease with chaperone function
MIIYLPRNKTKFWFGVTHPPVEERIKALLGGNT